MRKDLQNKSIEELLELIPCGVNLRQVVNKKYSIFDVRHYDKDKGDIKFMQPLKNGGYREMIKRPNKPGKYNKKWFAKIESTSCSTIRWSDKNCFVADTAKEALIKCYEAIKDKQIDLV